MDKKSFVLFVDRKKEIDLLSNEQCGILFKAIFAYVDGGKLLVTDDLALQVLFSLIKSQIDANNEKWQRIRQKRSEAGKKGGAKKGNQNAVKQKQAKQPNACFDKQKQTKQAVTDTVTVTGTVTTVPVIEGGTAPDRAAPPSKEKIIPWDDVDFELV